MSLGKFASQMFQSLLKSLMKACFQQLFNKARTALEVEWLSYKERMVDA